MEVINSLPSRPLSTAEVAALADAEGIEAVEAAACHPATGEVVAVGLIKESGKVFVGYHSERCRWEVIRRWGRERED